MAGRHGRPEAVNALYGPSAFIDPSGVPERELVDEAEKSFFEAALDIFVIVDAEGRFRRVNSQCERSLGWHDDELRGRWVGDYLHPEDRATFQMPEQGHGPWRLAGRFLQKDGQYRMLEGTVTFDPDRRLFLGVARDHTLPDGLRALSRAIVDEVEDYAIFQLDQDGIVQTWNRGAERCKGYDQDEAIGMHFSAFYPEGKQGDAFDLLAAARRDGRVEDEGWRVRKDGTRFWANVVITAVHDDMGRIAGFTKVTRDLTQRRAHEQEQRRRFEQETELEQAETINRLRGELLNLIAHELRTPLTPIQMQIHLLSTGAMGSMNEQQTQTIGVLDRNVRRLTTLVEDILQVSRMEAEKLAVKAQDVPVRQLFDDCVAMYGTRAAAKDIRLTLECDADDTVHADPDHLLQVVFDLLDNAIRATPRGGRVTLRSRDDGLEVEDTGRGLTESEQGRLFQPFAQVHDQDVGRTGLGLYICKGIVERHGGQLVCHSQGRDQGATFRIHLPDPSDL